jgi:hypothetical protein
MARAKYCLIASLVVHILAAIVVQYTVLAPVIIPVVEISDLPDALSVEIMETGSAVEEILLRRPEEGGFSKAAYEIGAIT